jgi:hypothetical protein
LPLITLILTDFTERIGGDFTHLLSERFILSNLFKNQFNQWFPSSFLGKQKAADPSEARRM